MSTVHNIIICGAICQAFYNGTNYLINRLYKNKPIYITHILWTVLNLSTELFIQTLLACKFPILYVSLYIYGPIKIKITY